MSVVSDIAGLSAVSDFIARTPIFGLDCETNIVPYFYHRKIRTVQIGNKEQQFVIDLLPLAGNVVDLCHAQGDYGERVSLYPALQRLKEILIVGLESNKCLKVGTSMRFDYETLKWCLGIRTWNLFDTCEADKVLHAGKLHLKSSELKSMKGQAARWLNLIIDKSKQQSFTLTLPLTFDQICYAAMDVRIPLAIMGQQVPAIAKAGLSRTVQIENDCLPAFGDMHLNGVLIDYEKWNRLLDGIKARHKTNINTLDEYFLPIVGSKNAGFNSALLWEEMEKAEAAFNTAPKGKGHKDERLALRKAYSAAKINFRKSASAKKKWEKLQETYPGEAAINYDSNSQLLEALRKMGYGKTVLPNTNDASLEKHAGDAVIDAIREFRETAKVLSTYGEAFLEKHFRKETGRVHSYIDQLGAETGRTTSVNPNIQNILKGDWRSCFICDIGWKVITTDYNGCELRILAELSKEPIWIEAFLKGWDVHSVGAEMLFGKRWTDAAEAGCKYVSAHAKCKCKGHSALRDQIKAINFGIAYGMEAKKLAAAIGSTVKFAQELLDNYRLTFPVLTACLKRLGQIAVSTLESRTLVGRRRFFRKPTWDVAKERAIERAKKRGMKPEEVETFHINSALSGMYGSIEREGKNTPIQGTNADLIKLAMGCGFDPNGEPYLWHIVEPVYGARLVNMVHDELVHECHEAAAENCKEQVENAMTRAGAEVVKSIPMTTESHIEGCWTK